VHGAAVCNSLYSLGSQDTLGRERFLIHATPRHVYYRPRLYGNASFTSLIEVSLRETRILTLDMNYGSGWGNDNDKFLRKCYLSYIAYINVCSYGTYQGAIDRGGIT
jgi:hypothetical protein